MSIFNIIIMNNIIIYIEHLSDVVISDIQELSNSMNSINFVGKTKLQPIYNNNIYNVNCNVKIIDIDYFDMYIKVINEEGSTFVGQIIQGLDFEFESIPVNININSYKQDKESYYLYATY